METAGGLGLLDRLEHLAPAGPRPDRRWLAERDLPSEPGTAVRDLFGSVAHTIADTLQDMVRRRTVDPMLVDWLATAANADAGRWPRALLATWSDTIAAMYEPQGIRDPRRVAPEERVGKRFEGRRFIDLELLVMAVEHDPAVQAAWAARPSTVDAISMADWFAEVPCEVLDPPRTVLGLVSDVLQHNMGVGSARVIARPRPTGDIEPPGVDDPDVSDQADASDDAKQLRVLADIDPSRLRAAANHLLLDRYAGSATPGVRLRVDARERPASVMLAVHAYAPASMKDVRHLDDRLRTRSQRSFLHLAVAAHTPSADTDLVRTQLHRTLRHLRAVLASADGGGG